MSPVKATSIDWMLGLRVLGTHIQILVKTLVVKSVKLSVSSAISDLDVRLGCKSPLERPVSAKEDWTKS